MNQNLSVEDEGEISRRDLYERKSEDLCDQLNGEGGEGGVKDDSEGSHLAAVSQLPTTVS